MSLQAHCTIFLILYHLFILMETAIVSKHIHCFDQPGTNPIPDSGMFKSTAQCPPSYFITSCGAVNSDPSTDDNLGSFIIDPAQSYQCLALSHNGRVTAHARCCNLTDYGNSYIVNETENEAQAILQCSFEHTLIGCTGDSEDPIFDGMFIGDASTIGDTSQPHETGNKCTSQNSGDSDVYTVTLCYDTSTINDGYTLDCVSVWGDSSNSNDHSSSVSCPSVGLQYFMTACHGYSPDGGLRSYSTVNDTCYVEDTGNAVVTANAICCSMAKVVTDSPTAATNGPTLSPSSIPTKTPTFDPTVFPTSIPTFTPINPTMYPSTFPTNNPTLAPINNPTVYPTIVPTTNIPTENPSVIPTTHPTLDLTNNPTITPTLPTRSINKTPKTTNSDGEVPEFETSLSNHYKPDQEKQNLSASVPYFIILCTVVILFCCVCVTVYKCVSKKNEQKYRIGNVKQSVSSGRIIKKHPEKQNIMLQMSKHDHEPSNVVHSITTYSDQMSVKDTGSFDPTPGSNILDDEFIVGDENDTVITPGDNTAGNMFMSDDEIVIGTDEEGTGNDTNESDEPDMITDECEGIHTEGN